MTELLHTLIAGMPKAELHMHLEGSLEPEMMFRLAKRNGIDLGFASEDALRQAYDFQNLQSFLDLYYAGLRVLLTRQDFLDMTTAYLDRVRQDNVVHAEVLLSPQGHTRRGVDFAEMFCGVRDALREGAVRHGMTTGLIIGFQRHLTEESAFETLRQSEPYAADILAFGLGGAELGNPPEKFARVFAECRARGFRTVAHAGEEGPPDYVRDSIDLLGVDRIDHGVRAAEDPALVARLAQLRVPLTVCPQSNVKLRVYDTMAEHSLAALLRAGVMVTINSDDPPYFGGYITDNFLDAQAALNLTEAEIYRIARNGFEAAFIDVAHRDRLVAGLDAFWIREAGALPA
ncbi:adenosine deaminase [Humitalea rosea]|uniref:Adenine deaminase n=1 Tax=Humitalea rosea TaxID=990373 RepID=A0A2W7IID3_9PROT|nr:adenosine deaminase [Humitalea rosea]PZW44905.1 adenosine deaminase [Humitalea rosea]